MDQKRRIYWVDVAKCFGIFAIYLGHCGEAAGAAGTFVHTHHVALFFFLSGCMENFNREPGIIKTAVKVLRRTLLPWLIFCALSLGLLLIKNIGHWNYLLEQLMFVLQGTVRGRFAAGSLWFLTCLAVIQLLFALLRKLKYKPLILLAAAWIYYQVQMTRVPSPLIWATQPFNLDSARCYILFYALGYLLFPYADRALRPQSRQGKISLGITVGLSLVYAVLVFVDRDPLATPYANLYIWASKYALLVHPVLRAMIIIWLYFAAAKLLENCTFLRTVGSNTLYLCGGEYLVKSGLSLFLAPLGISLYPNALWSSVVYSGAMLLLALGTVVPGEKWLLGRMETLFRRFSKKTPVNEG